MNEDEKILVKSMIDKCLKEFMDDYFGCKGEFEFIEHVEFSSIRFLDNFLKRLDEFINKEIEKMEKENPKFKKWGNRIVRKYCVRDLYEYNF